MLIHSISIATFLCLHAINGDKLQPIESAILNLLKHILFGEEDFFQERSKNVILSSVYC